MAIFSAELEKLKLTFEKILFALHSKGRLPTKISVILDKTKIITPGTNTLALHRINTTDNPAVLYNNFC